MMNKNTTKTGSDYPWKDAYTSLINSLEEEANILRETINDEDTCCAARDIRRARLSGIEHALAVADNLQRWEW